MKSNPTFIRINQSKGAMKNQRCMTAFLMVAIFLVLTSCTQNKEVTSPAVDYSNTSSLEIDKVVLTDSITTLYMSSYYRPSWWIKISSKSYLMADGKKYSILRSEGLELDKEFFLPKENVDGIATATFKLIFKAIPFQTKSIDFSEGPTIQNSFEMYGIRLDGTVSTNEIPKRFTTVQSTNFATPTFLNKPAKITGRILGYRKEMQKKINTLFISHPNVILRDRSTQISKISPDGTFTASIETLIPIQIQLGLGNQSIAALVAPGETTELVIDLAALSAHCSISNYKHAVTTQKVYFTGYMAEVQNELMQHPTIDLDLPAHVYTVLYAPQNKDLSYENFQELVEQNYKLLQQRIDSIQVSTVTKKYMQATLDYNAIQIMKRANSNLAYLFKKKNNLSKKAFQSYATDLMKKHPFSIEKEAKKYPAAFSTCAIIHGSLFNKQEDIDKTIAMGLYKKNDIRVTLSHYQEYSKGIRDFKPITNRTFKKIEKLDNPVVTAYLKEKNKELITKIEKNKEKTGYSYNTDAEKVKPKDFLSFLNRKYKGKVLLLDFWETYCGPCKRANKEMIPVKEKFKGKDIIFLYIASQNSPKSTWENSIPDIHGEHYRLSTAQSDYLFKNVLESNGVPTYLIVQKTGKISWKKIGFPGTEIIEKQIKKALKE